MKKGAFVTTLILNSCLLGNAAIAEGSAKTSHEMLMSMDAGKLPVVQRSLLQSAQAGDTNAQLALAQIYERQDFEGSCKLAAKWYRKSALNGNPEAQFHLGLLYIDGELPDGDDDLGLFWLEQAAEQGHQQAKIVYKSMSSDEFILGC